MSRLFNDATPDYLAYTSAAPVTAAPLTMASWIYLDDAAIAHGLITLGVAGQNNHRFSLVADGSAAGDRINAVTRTTSGGTSSSATGFSVNTWHHAAGVFASATSRTAYIDGVAGTANTSNLTPSGINAAYVGVTSALASPTSGRIAEVGIWNVALTDAEIAALARGVSPLRIRPQNLVAYWPLYGIASPEPDYRSGLYHLTLTGSPAQAEHARVWPGFGIISGWEGTVAAAGGGGGAQETVSDSEDATDSVANTITTPQSVADSVEDADEALLSFTFPLGDDSETVSDAVAALLHAVETVADGEQAADTVGSRAVYRVAVSDGETAVDAAGAGAIESLSDGETVTDLLTGLVRARVSVADAEESIDAIINQLLASVAVSDGVVESDVAAGTGGTTTAVQPLDVIELRAILTRYIELRAEI